MLGARKFAVIDVPPIGCCPYPRSLHPLGACIDVLNELARGFNKGVKAAMHGLSLSFQGFRYSVGSSHAVVQSIMKHPQRPGNGTGEMERATESFSRAVTHRWEQMPTERHEGKEKFERGHVGDDQLLRGTQECGIFFKDTQVKASYL